MLNLDWPLWVRLLLSFLVGSIPFAVVAMWGTGIDITQVGSRNPGFNNVLRVAGKRRGTVALIGDVAKGWVALGLLSRTGDTTTTLWLLGLGAILGHCLTPWLGFRGGKGVATSTGVFFYLEPWITLLFPAIYVPVRKFGRGRGWKQEGAIASLIALAAITVVVAGLRGFGAGLFASGIFVLVTLRHTSNLREVWAGLRAQT